METFKKVILQTLYCAFAAGCGVAIGLAFGLTLNFWVMFVVIGLVRFARS